MDTRGFNEKDIMSSLDGIAEAISAGGGGGSSLPEVNSDDNGKVLTVVNGAWDKATASGGGDNVFVVSFTLTPGESGLSITADKTFLEIEQAWKDNKVLIGKTIPSIYNPGSTNSYNFLEAYSSDGVSLDSVDFSLDIIQIYDAQLSINSLIISYSSSEISTIMNSWEST